MATAPFSIQEFVNASGTTSYRVTGSFGGERIRKNFLDSGKASAFCNEKNAAALKAGQAATQRAVLTTLTPAELAVAESAVAIGSWQLRAIIEAGVEVLSARSAHAAVKVEDLLEPFLKEIHAGGRWHSDLDSRIGVLIRERPGITLGDLTPGAVRDWLMGADVAVQTRRNRRAALSRFGSWLVDTGRLSANPCTGVRIAKPNKGHAKPPPATLTAAQSGALLAACASDGNRHALGHVVLTLLCGLRPSEADRLTWGEIATERAEIAVLGRKRGSKSRVVPLQPAALAWLAELDRRSAPGRHYRKALARAWADAGLSHSPDICRHTYATMRAAMRVPVSELAAEMGNSERVIHAHYRAAISPGDAEKFWALRPA